MPSLPARYPFNTWVRWGKETYPASHADSRIQTYWDLRTASPRPEPLQAKQDAIFASLGTPLTPGWGEAKTPADSGIQAYLGLPDC
jgi:hypothetical protein